MASMSDNRPTWPAEWGALRAKKKNKQNIRKKKNHEEYKN
jgi:hypothetical protein